MPRPTLLTTLATGAVMVACSGGGGAPGPSTGTEAGGAAADGAGHDATQLDADATSIDGDASGSADAGVDATADAVDDNRPVDGPASDALSSDSPADDGAASDACAPSAPSVACNPPSPAGWVLLPQADVTPAMTSWAAGILNDATTYPMFAVTTMTFGTVTVLARVEWHPPDFQNSVVHRGVTLYELAG
jgi:hypothetical protein